MFRLKTFFIKTVLYLFLLLGAAYIINFVIDRGLKKTGKSAHGEIQIWNDIFNSKINANLIILGSSRAWTSYNPYILDSVLHTNSYNLGIDGYPFNMQYIRFKMFEEYNQVPKIIIQNVDFNTLARRKDAYDKIQFVPYKNLDPLFRDELKKIGFSKLDLYVPLFAYHSEYEDIFISLCEFFNIKHFPSKRNKGYLGREMSWDDTKLNKIIAKDSLDIAKEPEIIDLFDAFLNYCKEKNIYVILVFAPQYIKATEFTRNKDEMIQLYNSFSKKYNIPFMNYYLDSMCIDTSYYYNATHFNKFGADLFSLKLASDIKQKLNIDSILCNK